MSAFTVELDNHPGELARLCEAMASSGVNLLLCATTHGNRRVVAFIADDEAAAQAVLDGAGIEYLLRPAVTVRMENLPGAGAAAFRKLAEAGVNVELLLPVPHLRRGVLRRDLCRRRGCGRGHAGRPGHQRVRSLGLAPPRQGWRDVLL